MVCRSRYEVESLSADDSDAVSNFNLLSLQLLSVGGDCTESSATGSHVKYVSLYSLQHCWYMWYFVCALHRAVDSSQCKTTGEFLCSEGPHL